MAKEVPQVRVRCLRNTTDSAYEYYVEGREYTVPMDHPCMQHFEPIEEVKPQEAEEERRAKRPVQVVRS